MIRHGRAAARRLAAVLVGVLVSFPSVAAPPASLAVVDTSPPTGSIELYAYQDQVIDLRLTFADPESGIDHLDVWCDANTPVRYPDSSRLLIPALDPSKGGCSGYGNEHWLAVQAYNGAGLGTYKAVEIATGPKITLSISSPALTGKPFTITPVVPSDYTLPSEAVCMWEFRWGDDASLLDNDFDETFGYVGFEGPKSKGYCGPWTFTLPYGPARQYQVIFSVPSEQEADPVVQGDSWGFPDDGRGFITAAVGTTERRITSSNLPLVFMLPDSTTMTVGTPITYRLYPLGGIPIYADDEWVAGWQAGEHAFVKAGGSTFTFTPDRAGSWSVFWNGGPHHPYFLGAAYDPMARARDTTRPGTTTPVTRLGPGVMGASMPGTVAWTGGDTGWGIDHYTLQRSVDGGAYGSSVLGTATSLAVILSPGHTYRFRVHAVDKAGNVGDWDYGPTFRVSRYQETSTAIHWKGTWSTGSSSGYSDGHARFTTAAGSSASFTFTGRSFAWVSATNAVRGSAKVYVNGVYTATVNLSSATNVFQRIVFARTWATSATRTITIVCAGTSGHPRIDVDAIVALR